MRRVVKKRAAPGGKGGESERPGERSGLKIFSENPHEDWKMDGLE